MDADCFERLHVGCAGWSLQRGAAGQLPAEGSQLCRYAAQFLAVEINSSFYRPHRPATYRRWAETVPANFRFAVKVPKQITHLLRLRDAEAPLDDSLANARNWALSWAHCWCNCLRVWN